MTFKNSFQILTLIITLASIKNLEAEPNPHFTWTHGIPIFTNGASHTLMSHSSEIRGLCLMKLSSEMLQN